MRGGLHLIAHKQQSLTKPVATLPAPKSLRLPIDATATLKCFSGQQLRMGEPIAQIPAKKSHWIVSPVSGIVSAIDTTDAALRIVHFENDFADTPHDSHSLIADYTKLTPQELCDRIDRAGIIGLGGAAFPTSIKLASITHSSITRTTLPTLVLNGAECEPFITCDDALMRENAEDVVLGAQILLHAANADKAIIGIETDKVAAIHALQTAVAKTGDSRLSVRTISTLYPRGDERQLISFLTGREVPSGGLPADVDTLCFNVGTAAAVANLIQSGRPLVERIVTLTGSGINEPQNYRVRLGTPIATLIAAGGGYSEPVEQLIVGGSMMGLAQLSDAGVIDASTNCIIVATERDLQPRGPEMPCIRCGDCSVSCPVNLLPQQLLRYARSRDLPALHAYGLRDCIECGCCDYVCPSQIPLTSQFVAAKFWVQQQ